MPEDAVSDPQDLDYRSPTDDVPSEDLALTGGISSWTTAGMILGATFIAIPFVGLASIAIGIIRLQRTPRVATRERFCAVVCVVLGTLNLIASWWWIKHYS